jgi:glutaredoxin 3
MSAAVTSDKPTVVIYTQALCGHCAAALALLNDKGVEFEQIDVTLDGGLRRTMLERTGRRSMPQIFVNEQHIGGYDDMAALDEAGKLDELLGLGD